MFQDAFNFRVASLDSGAWNGQGLVSINQVWMWMDRWIKGVLFVIFGGWKKMMAKAGVPSAKERWKNGIWTSLSWCEHRMRTAVVEHTDRVKSCGLIEFQCLGLSRFVKVRWSGAAFWGWKMAWSKLGLIRTSKGLSCSTSTSLCISHSNHISVGALEAGKTQPWGSLQSCNLGLFSLPQDQGEHESSHGSQAVFYTKPVTGEPRVL